MEEPTNLAYCPIGLPFHMDLTFYESPPGLQFLHCIRYLRNQVKFKLCPMTQVLLKLRFTLMERLSGYLFFIYKCAGILLTSTCITHAHLKYAMNIIIV